MDGGGQVRRAQGSHRNDATSRESKLLSDEQGGVLRVEHSPEERQLEVAGLRCVPGIFVWGTGGPCSLAA